MTTRTGPSRINDLLSPLTPLPYVQIKELARLLESGFRFEQARQIALTILELDDYLEAPVQITPRQSHRYALRVVPHPRGWTIISSVEAKPYIFFKTREEAVERARSDAMAAECSMCIHADSGELEDEIAAMRNY